MLHPYRNGIRTLRSDVTPDTKLKSVNILAILANFKDFSPSIQFNPVIFSDPDLRYSTFSLKIPSRSGQDHSGRGSEAGTPNATKNNLFVSNVKSPRFKLPIFPPVFQVFRTFCEFSDFWISRIFKQFAIFGYFDFPITFSRF